MLVKVLHAGICGTDRNIKYDEKDFPPGEDFLILGHFGMVGDTGFEPVTSAMSTQRSNQLS